MPQDALADISDLTDAPKSAPPARRAPRPRPSPPGLADISDLTEAPAPNRRQVAAPAAAAPVSSHPYGAVDSLTSGRWSLKESDGLRGWYRQTYGRDLPVSAEGQSGTHSRMGLDHSDSLDVAVSPVSEEGKALREYLRANRIPFLAYDRAVPGAATNAHFHVGFPSRKGEAGRAAWLGSVTDLLDDPADISDLVDNPARVSEEVGDVVTVNASSSPSRPSALPPLPKAPAGLSPAAAGRLRDAQNVLASSPDGRLDLDVPLPAGRRDWSEVSSEEASREAARAYARQKGIPDEFVSRWLGDNAGRLNLHLYGPDPQGRDEDPRARREPVDYVFEGSPAYDFERRTLRVSAEMPHLRQLELDYDRSLGALGRTAKHLEEAGQYSAGEHALGVLGSLPEALEVSTAPVTRPLGAASAQFWSRANREGAGAKLEAFANPFDVQAMRDAWGALRGERTPLSRNPIAESVERDMSRLHPAVGRAYGVLAELVFDPANLLSAAGALKYVERFNRATRAARAARGAEELAAAAREAEAVAAEARASAGTGEAAGSGRAALEGLGRGVESSPEVIRYGGREIVRVTMPDGTVQPFYRSTGNNSKRAGEWFPFDGVGRDAQGEVFLKERFAQGAAEDVRHPLHRYGSDDLRAQGERLRGSDIPAGREVMTPEEVNAWLRGESAPAVTHHSRHQPRTPGGQFDGPPDSTRADISDLVDPPARRTSAEVADDIRVTHARDRAEFYRAEAARAKDPAHRAEAERLAREYADEAADHAAELRIDDIAGRVRGGERVAPEEMADLERAVLSEDGSVTYAEVPASSAPAAALSTPRSSRSPLRRAWDAGLDAWDASKSLFASADLSAAGRQSFFPWLFDTRATARGLAQGTRSVSSRAHGRFMRWVDSHPTAKQWADSGLELDTMTGGRSEFFTSHLAEKIPGYGKAVIKPSDRAMTAQLDAVRLQVAESWAEDLRAAGMTFESHPEEYKAVAKLLNAASGRVPMGPVGQALYPVSRRVIFSPSLLKSRFTMMSPLTYARLPPQTRKIAAKKLGKAAAKMAGVFGLAALTADEVGLNPFKSNFGLARYGDTTYDLTGGTAGKLKLIFRLVQSAGATAAAYGKGESVEYKDTPWGIGLHFLRSQLAPSASFAVDAATGETYDRKPFDATEGVLRRITPGFAQDVYDGFVEGGEAGGAVKALPSFLGVSARTRNQAEMRREWAAAREASKIAVAGERTSAVLKDAPAEVRDELRRLRVYLPESDVRVAPELVEAARGLMAGRSWKGLGDAQRKRLLENIFDGVRKRAGAPDLERARRASRANEEERVQLSGRAAEEVERLGVLIDPVFAGHKVGTMTGESVGFKGQHVGQDKEMLDDYRRRLAEETQREVERVMSFRGFDSRPDAVRRRALQEAVDRVKRRVRGPFHYQTRRRDHVERERLEQMQRRLENRSPRLKPGETLKLGDGAPKVGASYRRKSDGRIFAVREVSGGRVRFGERGTEEGGGRELARASFDRGFEKTEHKFSSTQVDLPEEAAREVREVGERLIPDSALYTEDGHGREESPHVTVKYGLHTEDASKVRRVLARAQPVTVELGKVSVFPGREGTPYDVVKVEVESRALHRLNRRLGQRLRVTDTHPDYKPHVTLAYVRKGEGQRFAGDRSLEGRRLTFDSVTFSSSNGETTRINLGGATA